MKKAFITGANKGIGFETAKQLLDLGYYLYIGSRDIEKGKEAVEKLNSEYAEAIQIDISNEQSIVDARKTIGGKTDVLDVLVNNAGIAGPFPQNLIDLNTNVIRDVFDTNFFGTINVTRYFLDLLKVSATPRIVNVSSGLGSLTLHSDPSWMHYNVKSGAYGPSKTALNAYTIVLAYELKDTPIKINAVDPGYTATDFNHHSGPGKVEDAATIIVKFATLDADGPTGKFFSNESEASDQQIPW
jgi:NAD(P)-dependent dehydrogenase (short-subunit alcohol dehydrogenase family)